jgi:hypothetical protein
MTIQSPLRLYGEHCSPYTRKMLSGTGCEALLQDSGY